VARFQQQKGFEKTKLRHLLRVGCVFCNFYAVYIPISFLFALQAKLCWLKSVSMAGKIIIDIERCKGCGLCVAVCPKNAIVISNKSNKTGYFPAQAKNTDCTGCAMCAIICPDAAIEVHRDEASIIGADMKPNKKKVQSQSCKSG